MSSALEFYYLFRDAMAGRGIRFVLTSGMACVEYGLQQNTKDTDWIVDPEDLDKLVAMLCEFERGLSGKNWRISYRNLFGAPLDAKFHLGGWTTHLAIWDGAESPEHHLDFFGRPPRIIPGTWQKSTGLLASRDIVARMKKTDRSKDWPIVNALAAQDWFAERRTDSLLHLTEIQLLREAWGSLDNSQRQKLSSERPLLNLLDSQDDLRLERSLLLERALWGNVNRERYLNYQSNWKSFYRSWQQDEVGTWPSSQPFAVQHKRVLEASAKHGLTPQPFAEKSLRQEIFERGKERTKSLIHASEEELQSVAMPIEIILP